MSTADEPRTEAGRQLIRAYAKSGLPIRAEEVIAIEAEAARQTEPRLDAAALATLLGDHRLLVKYGYEEECSCGRWYSDHARTWEQHLVAAYEAAASEEDGA